MYIYVCIYIFSDGFSKIVLAHLLAATSIGIITAAAMHFRRKIKSKSKSNDVSKDRGNGELVPILDRTESGRVGKLERFPDYVGK